MRVRDASWTSHDDCKHVKCTRDGNGFTRPIDSKTGVLEYDILKRYVLEKPPATSLYTTLIVTNRHSR
jgi:hypothetical protein